MILIYIIYLYKIYIDLRVKFYNFRGKKRRLIYEFRVGEYFLNYKKCKWYRKRDRFDYIKIRNY